MLAPKPNKQSGDDRDIPMKWHCACKAQNWQHSTAESVVIRDLRPRPNHDGVSNPHGYHASHETCHPAGEAREPAAGVALDRKGTQRQHHAGG